MTEPPQVPSRLLKELNEASSKHLTYAQLEGFVDSRLESTEEAFVRAHIELCSQCKREMEDLKWFRESRSYREQVAAAAAAASPAPTRPSFWAVGGHWLKVPMHRLTIAGAAMVMVALVVVLARLHRPSSSPPMVATTAPPAGSKPESPGAVTPKPEAVLEAPPQPVGAVGSNRPRFAYRVLPEAEANAYREELAHAPDDPETRAAIAIKFGLYGEAEKEYRKMEAGGGEQAEKAHRLMAELNRLRGH